MPKKQLNVKLLFWTLMTLVILGTSVHLLHGFQVSRHARTLLEQADQAEKEGHLDQAAIYLSRYLVFTPDDVEVMARYGLTLDKLPTSPRTSQRILALFRQVLNREPDRQDVRRRLVARAMELDFTDEAQEHLEILLRASPGQGELEGLLAQCQEANDDYAQAAQSYRQAIAHAPDQIDCAVRLAELLRQRLGQPKKADRVMNALVKFNPRSAQAHLARARYRAALGATESAARDLDQARKLAPRDAAVLTASADLARRQGDFATASAYWRRGLKLHPHDLGMYLGLAGLELEAHRPGRVITCLRRGLKQFPDHPDLLRVLAEVFIDQGKRAEAKKVIARLRQRGRHPTLADYLDGRLLMRRHQWLAAARLLAELDRSPDLADDLAGRACLALGDCYERLGDGDRQLAAYRKAVELDPAALPGRLRLGAALLTAGKIEEAVEQCRQLTHQPGTTEECWILLGRALLQHCQRWPERQRDWRELDQTLNRAARSPAQAAAVAVLRAEALSALGQPERARAVLEQARTNQPDHVALWQSLANLAARQGDRRQVERIWDQAVQKLGNGVAVRLAQVEFWSRQGGDPARRHLVELEDGLEEFSAGEQRRLLGRLAEAYYRLGIAGEAERLCRQLAQRDSSDLGCRLLLLDLALQSGRDEAVRQLLADVRRLEGDEGTWWRYGEAARLVARVRQGDRAGLARAGVLLREVADRRPGWPRVPLLRAQIAELEGRPAQALDGYLRALELGDCQPAVVYRAVQILAAGERYREADQVIRKLQPQGPLGRDFARLAAEIALRARHYERAQELAWQAVPASARDYRDFLWLARVLASVGRQEEAEEACRQAVRLAPRAPESWVALVAHLAHTDQADRVEAVLIEVRSALPPDLVPLVLAQAYEALGRTGPAEEQYQAALVQRPDDFPVLQRAAMFYLRSLQPRKAEPLLRQLLDPTLLLVPGGTAAWARRRLALVLASTEGGRREALALLEQNRRAVGATVADQQAWALVLAAQPDRRRQALRIVEDSLARQALAPEDQFRLAQLYEADNDWPRARAQLRALLDVEGQNPAYLAHFIGELLRRGEAAEAVRWLDRLEAIEPDSPRTRALQAALARASKRTPRKK